MDLKLINYTNVRFKHIYECILAKNNEFKIERAPIKNYILLKRNDCRNALNFSWIYGLIGTRLICTQNRNIS